MTTNCLPTPNRHNRQTGTLVGRDVITALSVSADTQPQPYPVSFSKCRKYFLGFLWLSAITNRYIELSSSRSLPNRPGWYGLLPYFLIYIVSGVPVAFAYSAMRERWNFKACSDWTSFVSATLMEVFRTKHLVSISAFLPDWARSSLVGGLTGS